jgi:hypothetical protein
MQNRTGEEAIFFFCALHGCHTVPLKEVLHLSSNISCDQLLKSSTATNNNRYTKEIDETIVEIDSQLSELDQGSIYSLPHKIILIRQNFYRLFHFLKGCDIDKFANHKPGEKTPPVADHFYRHNIHNNSNGERGCC